MKSTLYVRTKTQKAIFENELQGQLSDGNWENTNTDSRLWDCDVRVTNDKSKLGCNFAVRHPVNFADEDMIGWIGDRMVKYGSAVNPSYNEKKLVADLNELTKIVFRSRK
jgi:hypothetical protein